MREIPMSNKPGLVALVDDKDFERLSKHRWRAKQDRDTWYAYTDVYEGEKRRMKSMHGMIIKSVKPQIDHIDHDGLNNQRSNLRAATNSENQRNRSKEKGNTSGFKGVSFQKSTGMWQASIRVNGKLEYLGASFGTAEEAARAYDEAATWEHGKFANPNFPQEK